MTLGEGRGGEGRGMAGLFTGRAVPALINPARRGEARRPCRMPETITVVSGDD